MKFRNFLIITIVGLMALAVLAPMVASASTFTPDRQLSAQDGPTATPSDPSWLGFVAARDALSEELDRRITLVNRWTFAQTEFLHGIAEGCTTLTDDDGNIIVDGPPVYFGWRYVITLLNGNAYEIRVSFDLLTAIVCDEVTVDSGGTDTGSGTIPTDIGTVATGPMEIGAQVPNRLGSTEIQYLEQAEMTWIKVQGRPGLGFTSLISNAHANGFKVLMSVVGDKSQVMTAGYRETYVDYLAALARDGADAIEVWNEPNLAHEWPVGQINGANYTSLLQLAYPAIKEANSNTIVISASPAPTGAFGAGGCTDQGCNDDAFYRQMAEAGAATYADCIGVHYNEGIISPTATTGDPRDNYPTRYFGANLNRAMANFPGMVACFTEIGYLSPEGYGTLPGNFAWAQDTSVAEQAEWIAQAAVLSSQLGNVRLFIVFNLNFSSFGADPQGGYGLVRPDGSCPGCDTLAAIQ